MGQDGHIFFLFPTVTQDQIGKFFCYTSRKQTQIGHLARGEFSFSGP